jgi:hypothetical protein
MAMLNNQRVTIDGKYHYSMGANHRFGASSKPFLGPTHVGQQCLEDETNRMPNYHPFMIAL